MIKVLIIGMLLNATAHAKAPKGWQPTVKFSQGWIKCENRYYEFKNDMEGFRAIRSKLINNEVTNTEACDLAEALFFRNNPGLVE